MRLTPNPIPQAKLQGGEWTVRPDVAGGVPRNVGSRSCCDWNLSSMEFVNSRHEAACKLNSPDIIRLGYAAHFSVWFCLSFNLWRTPEASQWHGKSRMSDGMAGEAVVYQVQKSSVTHENKDVKSKVGWKWMRRIL
jgi:hypothetical protein